MMAVEIDEIIAKAVLKQHDSIREKALAERITQAYDDAYQVLPDASLALDLSAAIILEFCSRFGLDPGV